MKRLAFVLIGFAVGLGPLWFSLTRELPNPTPEEIKKPTRDISSTPSEPAKPTTGKIETSSSLKSEIQTAKECYKSQDCNYPQTDARSYEFAVSKHLAQLLKEYRETYPTADDLGEIASTFVQAHDGHVQEEALKIFAMLPPSPQNLDAILAGVTNTPDPLIVAQTMEELKRYMGTSDEARVQEFLSELMAHGAQYSSEKAAEMILSFINERNVEFFRAALNQMTPGSSAADHLRTALREFQRMQRGG